MDVRRISGILAIVFGATLVLAGIGTWTLVSTTLSDQNITTADDACLAGQLVDGPFTAYCEAQVIEEHARNATDGLSYAELERDDPRRDTAMRASFLRASLFTSVVAFGVAAMATAMGVLFVLLGIGMRDVDVRLDDLEVAGRKKVSV